MPSFAAQQSLFRAYDIRGSRQHFTADFTQALGQAFAHLYDVQDYLSHGYYNKNDESADNLAIINQPNKSIKQNSHIKQNTVVIGYDVRCGSDNIAHTLANILTRQGLQIIQLGLITTPMMVFWAEHYQGHGIIVTASHSAKDILGVKWLVNHASPSSEDIQTLYQKLAIRNVQKNPSKTFDAPINNKPINLPTEQVSSAYTDAIVQVFGQLYQHDNPHQHPYQNSKDSQQLLSKLDLTVVIDCMHGATSHIAQPLFAHFCQQVIMLHDTPDGHFPSGNPDPTEPLRLKQLQQSVLDHQADIGIAFDGDGDRLMVVDNNGKVVTPDHLLYLLASVAVKDRPQSLTTSLSDTQVLFDIKCCHHLPKLIAELGATAVMSQTGSSLIRRRLQQSNNQIIFAGELSGHFIFNDNRFILYDDAMYAALRLLHWLAHPMSSLNIKTNLAKIIRSLPVIVSTADHYLPLPETLANDCSIIEKLARFCQYLQHLINATSVSPTQSDSQTSTACASSLCNCSTKKHSITLEQAQDLLPIGTKLSCIDGVRLDFSHGFGVLRQSNTSHNLTARFAGDSLEDLRDIQTRFATLCRPFDATLAAQIMTIVPE
ncbi:MAG: phosphomannomutase [Psychrobacter sp.]